MTKTVRLALLCMGVSLGLPACSDRPGGSPSPFASRLVSAVRDTLRARTGYALAQPVSTSLDRAGNYVIADASDKSLKRYDHTGAEVPPVGRPGSGPGEFRSLMGGGTIGDSLFAYDFAGTRLSVFDPAGKYARSFSLWHPGDPMPASVRVVDDSLFLAVGFPLGSPGKELVRLVRRDGSTRSSFFNRREYFHPDNADLVQSSVVVADGGDGVVFAALMGGDSIFAYDYDGKLLGAGPIVGEDGKPLATFRSLIEANGGSRFRPDRSVVTEGHPALVSLAALRGGRAVLQVMDIDYHGQGRLERTDGGTFAAAVLDRASGSVSVSGHRAIEAGLQGRSRDGGALLIRYLGDQYEAVEVSELRIQPGRGR